MANRYFLIAVLLLFLCSITAGTTYYVDEDDPNAYQNIQDAINDANDGDTIIVNFGIYSDNLNMLGKAITLQGTDSPDPNMTSSPVINGCITCNSGEDANTIIEGFYLSASHYGVDCNSSSPTVKYCKFTNVFYPFPYLDYTGKEKPYTKFKGINCYQSNSLITDCVFMSNGYGAINCESSDLEIRNCTFVDNGSQYNSGAVRSVFSNLKITDCLFSNNLDGGLYFYCLNGLNHLEIKNCEFVANTDGAIYCYNCDSNSIMAGCTIAANSNSAVRLYKTAPSIINCTFKANYNDSGSGGAIVLNEAQTTINNSIFTGNSVYIHGGAIYCSNNSILDISGCTFTENESDCYYDGGAIYNANEDSSQITIANSIICGNTSNELTVDPIIHDPNLDQVFGNFIDNGGNQIGLFCPPSMPRGFRPSDSNADSKVNLIDFADLAQNWLEQIEQW